MFSESFAGGWSAWFARRRRTCRLRRPFTGTMPASGYVRGTIWREVIDLLARLDGIDFRQTAPVRPGDPFLKPYGQEWLASEDALTRPLAGHQTDDDHAGRRPDQGNIGLNLADAEKRGLTSHVLFLAGSAINSIKNAAGQYDPPLGAEAMLQALEVHRGEIGVRCRPSGTCMNWRNWRGDAI